MFNWLYSSRLEVRQQRLLCFPQKKLACLLPLHVTVSNAMASNTHDPAELGELERDLLSIVWRLGTVTADQAREE